MKRLLVRLMLLAVFCTVPYTVHAKTRGIGIILGEPTGLSYKQFLNTENAFDVALGWSAGRNERIHVHVDYLWHNYDVLARPLELRRHALPLYYGIGGKFTAADDPSAGIRVPVGVDFIFDNAPIDIFLELVPGISVMPETSVDIDFGLGVRFWF